MDLNFAPFSHKLQVSSLGLTLFLYFLSFLSPSAGECPEVFQFLYSSGSSHRVVKTALNKGKNVQEMGPRPPACMICDMEVEWKSEIETFQV